MRIILWLGFIVLFVVHQDFWFWDDDTLIFGFLPIGLAYHAGFSAAAATLWLLMVKLAWPSELEAWADVEEGKTENQESGKAENSSRQT